MESRILMLELVRRSLVHLYHSLSADLKVSGKCRVAGCRRSSTRSEIRLPGCLCEPAIRLPHKAGMRLLVRAGVESNRLEGRGSALGVRAEAAQAGRHNYNRDHVTP